MDGMTSSLRSQRPGDAQIHTPTYNTLVQRCYEFMRQRFDPKFFMVSGGYISLKALKVSAELDAEWAVSVSADSPIMLSVIPADVPWVTRTILAPREGDPLVIVPFVVDLTDVTVGQKRWLCVKIDHRANNGAGALSAEITADDQKALCDPANGITRVNLSCWEKVTETSIQRYGPQAHVGQIAFYPAEPPPLP